jgi:hypothetical protein
MGGSLLKYLQTARKGRLRFNTGAFYANCYTNAGENHPTLSSIAFAVPPSVLAATRS